MIVGCLATLAGRLSFQSLLTEQQKDMKRRGERRNKKGDSEMPSQRQAKEAVSLARKRVRENGNKFKEGETGRKSENRQ